MQMLKLAIVVVVTCASYMSVAEAAPVTTVCGASIKSVTKTNIDFFSSSSEQPVNITGAAVNITVPAGQTRCVRVRFSAVANCPHSCFVRAFANTNELNPSWTANPLRFSNDLMNSGTAHSFEWAERLGPGDTSSELAFTQATRFPWQTLAPTPPLSTLWSESLSRYPRLRGFLAAWFIPPGWPGQSTDIAYHENLQWLAKLSRAARFSFA